MKFLNLKRKLKNSALAVLFAVAVMFVMPAAVFADDTDVVETETTETIESTITNETVETTATAETTATTEIESEKKSEIDDFYEIEADRHICCADCHEGCDGSCCEKCNELFCDLFTGTIDNADDLGSKLEGNSAAGESVPGNNEDEAGNISGENDWLDDTHGGNDAGSAGNTDNNGILGNSEDKSKDDPTAGMGAPDNVGDEPCDIPKENGWLDDNHGVNNAGSEGETIPPATSNNNNDVLTPENPEYVYQPNPDNEYNESTDGTTNNTLKSEDVEEIIYGDLKDEEIEIITGGDLTNEEKTEIPEASDDESSDSILSEEELKDSEEDADITTNDESKDDNSNNAADEDNAADSDGTVDENSSDNAADEENTDNSDNTVDENNSDNEADEEKTDDSDSEASEDDNPIINVVLPASISVVVNPYNLKTNDGNEFCYSILSPEYAVKNYSNCGVSIVATVTASTTGGIVLSPNSLSGNETDFMAFVYLEATNESNVYLDKYNASESQLAFSNEAVSKKILMLADGSNGETIGYFRIKGDAVLPVGQQCADQATINMVITFDIEPVGKSVVSDNESEETESTENLENVDNAEDSETVENTENSGNIDNTEGSETVENTENSGNVDNTEDSETVENTENSGNIENTENSETVENTEDSETVENTENSGNVDNTEGFETVENTESLETVENTENSGNVDDVVEIIYDDMETIA